MIVELLIILIILILVILFLFYKILSNKFKIINIKINKSEKKLIDVLKEKFNLTLKSIDILNNQKNFDENLYHDFLNINLENINLIDLNNTLIDTDMNIEKYLSQNEKLINDKKYKEIYNKINNINITINATRKYYNENIEEFNKLIKKFPTSFIAKIFKYTEKDKLKDNKNKKLKILN